MWVILFLVLASLCLAGLDLGWAGLDCAVLGRAELSCSEPAVGGYTGRREPEIARRPATGTGVGGAGYLSGTRR